MSAQIIPFPKLPITNEGVFLGRAVAKTFSAVSPRILASGLHLVESTRPNTQVDGSQQTACRIVEKICVEHDLQHPADGKSEEFWTAVPVPPARAETPLSVMRRVAHMLLLVGEFA